MRRPPASAMPPHHGREPRPAAAAAGRLPPVSAASCCRRNASRRDCGGLAEYGGNGATAQAFLHRPQQPDLPADADQQQPVQIEAEAATPDP